MPPNFDDPDFDTPQLQRRQTLTTPKLQQPQIATTPKRDNLEMRRPQNATTPNATTPKLPKKKGQERASNDFYDFFPERQLNLLVRKRLYLFGDRILGSCLRLMFVNFFWTRTEDEGASRGG